MVLHPLGYLLFLKQGMVSESDCTLSEAELNGCKTGFESKAVDGKEILDFLFL